MVIFEICTETLAGAIAAEQGGAHRIELCAHLELDGLTPNPDLLLAVKEAVEIPVLCMVRPHPGSFCYTEPQLQDLLDDAQRLIALGADGLVVGMLTSEGTVDMVQLQRFMKLNCGMPVTFHKAFDVLAHQEEGLEQLIQLGVQRVLTSGGAATAEQGIDQLEKLVRLAAGRIEIVVGGGLRAHNVKALRTQTKALAFHSALDRNPTVESVGKLVQSL